MGLINPKPRFAYDDEANAVYDYVKQRDAALTEVYSAPDGVWNLFEVKRLILAGLPVEGARIEGPEPAPAPVASQIGGNPAVDPVSGQPLPAPGHEPNGAIRRPAPTPTGLSVAQLLGIKLSALQAAALGITPVQLSATGVTADQVAAWGLTAERADALNLTAEQRAVLMP